MRENTLFRKRPTYLWSNHFDKNAKTIQWGKEVFETNGAEITR